MDSGPNPYDEQPAAPADPGRPPRRVSRAAITVGLAAFLALAGAGAAFAFTGSGSTANSTSGSASSSTTAPSSPPAKGPMFPHGRGFGPMMGGFGGFAGGFGGQVVHGQYTVKTSSGYQTVLEQVGTVVTVSSSSIEVKSADGYVHTYTVQSSTVVDSQANGIGAVAKNDQVRMEAVQQSGKDVATNIVDTTKIGSSRSGFGFNKAPSPQQAPQPPQPGTSSASQANVSA